LIERLFGIRHRAELFRGRQLSRQRELGARVRLSWRSELQAGERCRRLVLGDLGAGRGILELFHEALEELGFRAVRLHDRSAHVADPPGRLGQ
jgi:hypothetical protein